MVNQPSSESINALAYQTACANALLKSFAYKSSETALDAI